MHSDAAVGSSGTDRFDIWSPMKANHVFTVRPEADPAFAERVVFTRFDDSAIFKTSPARIDDFFHHLPFTDGGFPAFFADRYRIFGDDFIPFADVDLLFTEIEN